MCFYYGTKKNKGQSTIEYLIVVTAVIAAVFLFAKKDSFLRKTLNATYAKGTNSILNLAGILFK